jgi:hypothetical protein
MAALGAVRGEAHRNVILDPSSASTSASVPPPASYAPTTPQSSFGGPSPTSELHPSSKLVELDSMFITLTAQAPSSSIHAARLPYRAGNSSNKRRLPAHISCRFCRCQCRFPESECERGQGGAVSEGSSSWK